MTSETPTRPEWRANVRHRNFGAMGGEDWTWSLDYGERRMLEGASDDDPTVLLNRIVVALAGCGGEVPNQPTPPTTDAEEVERLRAVVAGLWEQIDQRDREAVAMRSVIDDLAGGAVAVPPADRDLTKRAVVFHEDPEDYEPRAVAVPEDRPAQITDEMVERATVAARHALDGLPRTDGSGLRAAVRAGLAAALGEPTAPSGEGASS